MLLTVRGSGGGRCCLSCWGGCSSFGLLRGRPGPRFFSPGTGSGVDDDLRGHRSFFLMYWRFLTPFVCCFVGGERNFEFWTWDARAGSLNALDAVAGAGVSVIWGVDFGVEVCCGRFFGVASG